MIRIKNIEKFYLPYENNWKYPPKSFMNDFFMNEYGEVNFQKFKEVFYYNYLSFDFFSHSFYKKVQY